jgi:hypothetical protein
MSRIERVTSIQLEPGDDLLVVPTDGVGVTLIAPGGDGEEIRVRLRICPAHVAQLESAAIALRNMLAAANETQEDENDDNG